MIYLWIFGNNVEDSMGHVRFVIFYVLCGLAAVFAQALPEPGSTIPMVGASGAISGVLGAYMLLFPRAGTARAAARLFDRAARTIPGDLGAGCMVRHAAHHGHHRRGAVAGRQRRGHRLRCAHRRLHRGIAARRGFQKALRAIVAASLRR